MLIETKSDVLAVFGSIKEAANALSISRQALSIWNEKLTQSQADRATGCAVRLGLLPPCQGRQKKGSTARAARR